MRSSESKEVAPSATLLTLSLNCCLGQVRSTNGKEVGPCGGPQDDSNIPTTCSKGRNTYPMSIMEPIHFHHSYRLCRGQAQQRNVPPEYITECLFSRSEIRLVPQSLLQRSISQEAFRLALKGGWHRQTTKCSKCSHGRAEGWSTEDVSLVCWIMLRFTIDLTNHITDSGAFFTARCHLRMVKSHRYRTG